eukprot:2274831-Heterocapsa_arctica.AAC.1
MGVNAIDSVATSATSSPAFSPCSPASSPLITTWSIATRSPNSAGELSISGSARFLQRAGCAF